MDLRVQTVGSILAGVPLLIVCFCSCLCLCHSFASSRSAGDTHMCRQRASDSHLSCRCSSELFLCRLLDAAPVGCQTCTSTGPSFSGFLESLRVLRELPACQNDASGIPSGVRLAALYSQRLRNGVWPGCCSGSTPISRERSKVLRVTYSEQVMPIV